MLEADDSCWLARHMLETFPVALIEPDARRRAQISFASSQAGLHLEPYESAHELQGLADKRAVLVHDDGQQLAETLDRCDRAGHWIPIVAYSEQPTSTRVAEAIFAGALDYLALPFSPADLSLSLERVRERAVGGVRGTQAGGDEGWRGCGGRVDGQVVIQVASGGKE